MSRRAAWARRGLRSHLTLKRLARDGADLSDRERLIVLAVAVAGQLDVRNVVALVAPFRTDTAVPFCEIERLARDGWIEKVRTDPDVYAAPAGIVAEVRDTLPPD